MKKQNRSLDRLSAARNKRSLAKRQLRGSVSLMAAIMISVITLTALNTAKAVSYQQRALALERLADLQNEQILSLYERDILAFYGLWAYDMTLPDRAFNAREVKRQIPQSQLRQLPEYPLSDADVFMKQALSFSKNRLPLDLAQELYERVKAIAAAGSLLSDEKVSKAIEGIKSFLPKLQSPGKLPGLPAESSASGACLPPSAAKTALLKADIRSDDKPSENNSGGEEQEAEQNKEKEQNALNAWFDFERALSQAAHETNISGDNLSTSGFALSFLQLLEQASKLLDFKTPAFSDRFIMQEYILNQFTSVVRGPRSRAENGKNFRTLTGRLMSEYKTKSNYEAESIITGIKSDRHARLAVRALIVSSRAAFNYAAEINNEAKMAIHKAKASAIAAGVLLLSAGTVEIDPQQLAYVLAIVPALNQSAQDLQTLEKGRSIAIYKDPQSSLSKLGIYYIDYLRLMALFRSPEDLAEAASHCVIRNSGCYGMCGIKTMAALQLGRQRISYERSLQYAVLEKD